MSFPRIVRCDGCAKTEEFDGWHGLVGWYVTTHKDSTGHEKEYHHCFKCWNAIRAEALKAAAKDMEG